MTAQTNTASQELINYINKRLYGHKEDFKGQFFLGTGIAIQQLADLKTQRNLYEYQNSLDRLCKSLERTIPGSSDVSDLHFKGLVEEAATELQERQQSRVRGS